MTKEVVQSCRIKPSMNMIMFHPNVYADTLPLLSYMKENGVTLGAYSSCKPLWEPTKTGVVEVVDKMAGEQAVTADQILLAWARLKG